MNRPALPTPVGDGYSAIFKPGETPSLYKETRVQVIGVNVVTLEQCEQYAKDYHAWKMGAPYAYAVYFPDQPCEEIVHDLDELMDDLTSREHEVTPLYAPKEES